jgi:DNA-binding GntR family transcriptional regulator
MTQDAGRTPPKYRQVADDLRAGLDAGGYGPAGSLLPTKRELMRSYGASLGTIDHAIAELRALGYVETRQGAGMFVRTPPERPDAGDRPAREQVAGLQQEVAELRRQVRGHADLAARVGRIEANLVALYGQLNREYPRGGRRERAETASAGRR